MFHPRLCLHNLTIHNISLYMCVQCAEINHTKGPQWSNALHCNFSMHLFLCNVLTLCGSTIEEDGSDQTSEESVISIQDTQPQTSHRSYSDISISDSIALLQLEDAGVKYCSWHV